MTNDGGSNAAHGVLGPAGGKREAENAEVIVRIPAVELARLRERDALVGELGSDLERLASLYCEAASLNNVADHNGNLASCLTQFCRDRRAIIALAGVADPAAELARLRERDALVGELCDQMQELIWAGNKLESHFTDPWNAEAREARALIARAGAQEAADA